MVDTTTAHRRYHFAAKAGAPDYWIALEQTSDGDLPCLTRGRMGLNLKAGTSQERALEIARFLNENIVSVSYTA